MQFCTDLLRCNFLYIRCARNNISFSSHLSSLAVGAPSPPLNPDLPNSRVKQTNVARIKAGYKYEYGFYSSLVQNQVRG